MAEYYATKSYSGRAKVGEDFSSVSGSFNANSNDDKIAQYISKDASCYADHAMKIASRILKERRDD